MKNEFHNLKLLYKTSLFLLVTNSIYTTEPIAYLEWNSQSKANTALIAEKIQEAISFSIHSQAQLINRELILEGIKAYILCADPADEKSLIKKEDLFQLMHLWTHNSQLSQTDLEACFKELATEMKTISLMLNPDLRSVSKKKDLQAIASKCIAGASKENFSKALVQVTKEKEDLPCILTLLAGEPSSLKSFLSHLYTNQSQDDLALHYLQLIPQLDIETVDQVYQSLSSPLQNAFFEAMFFLYPTSEKLRHYVHIIFPMHDEQEHLSLAKLCVKEKRTDLLNALFTLVQPKSQKILEKELGYRAYSSYRAPLPGRLGQESLFHTRLGSCDIYFSMNLEKFGSICNLVESINKTMTISVEAPTLPYHKACIIPEIIKQPTPLGYDQTSKPIYTDSIGIAAIEKYLNEGIKNVNHTLGSSLENPQVYINLALNQDNNSWGQDYFPKNTLSHAESLSHRVPLYEYSLADWQISEGTIGGLVLQDGSEGDRFIIPIFPRDLFCMHMVEKQKSLKNEQPTLPPYTVLSPIDYQSTLTPGSTKGKYLLAITRGELPSSQLDITTKKSKELDINRYNISDMERKYPNGITFKKLHSTSPKAPSLEWIGCSENVDIFKIHVREVSTLLLEISNLFNISNVNVESMRAYRLVKRTPGLSHLDKINLDIPEKSTIIMINRSELPEGYKYFNIAEDQTDIGNPWIQLYRFLPNTVMKVDCHSFNRLSLSPSEEILYRDDLNDATEGKESTLKPRIVSEIDLYVFPSLN